MAKMLGLEPSDVGSNPAKRKAINRTEIDHKGGLVKSAITLGS